MLPPWTWIFLATAPSLTAALVDVESVSGGEADLAAAIERALRACAHLSVHRDGNTVVARTSLGRPQRVIVAGHIDTVPIAGNLPSRRENGLLYGCGSCDMKSGVAVALRLAARLTAAAPGRHLGLLRLRGGRGRAQRAAAGVPSPARPAAG